MANKVVIFPEAHEAAALAYQAAVNAHYAATFEAGGMFAYIRNDAYGQWVVPYYGAPWTFDGVTAFDEPAECLALRPDGVLHDFAVWPDPEI